MGRFALLVGVSKFSDERFGRLNAPEHDVRALAELLEDTDRGNFDVVSTYFEGDYLEIRDRLHDFFEKDRSPDDLLLFYYSGHGILGRGGHLYFASSTSSLDRPSSRSIRASELRELMARSRSGKQIIILDCCHSGAFSEGIKGSGTVVMTNSTFGTSEGEGYFVLSATDSLQYAYDGNGMRMGDGTPALSRFTSWLVDGIGKGEAAPDESVITMDSLYGYLRERRNRDGIDMTPQRFVARGAGDLIISLNPSGGIASVDSAVVRALASDDWVARKGAVLHLNDLLLTGSSPQKAGARILLAKQLENEFDLRVRGQIEVALKEYSRLQSGPLQELVSIYGRQGGATSNLGSVMPEESIVTRIPGPDTTSRPSNIQKNGRFEDPGSTVPHRDERKVENFISSPSKEIEGEELREGDFKGRVLGNNPATGHSSILLHRPPRVAILLGTLSAVALSVWLIADVDRPKPQSSTNPTQPLKLSAAGQMFIDQPVKIRPDLNLSVIASTDSAYVNLNNTRIGSLYDSDNKRWQEKLDTFFYFAYNDRSYYCQMQMNSAADRQRIGYKYNLRCV